MSGAGPGPVPARPGAPARPLFVERQTYRRRRLIDACRALPVLGLMLWWLPLLWQHGEEPFPASLALVFIFLVWCGLALAAFMFSRAIRRNVGMDYGGDAP